MTTKKPAKKTTKPIPKATPVRLSGDTPTTEETDAVINECMEHFNNGTSKYHGMTYEQGVRAGIEWMLGEGDNPMSDE